MNKGIQYLSVILFMTSGLFAQKFYQPDSIQEIRLIFTQPNWDYLLDTAKAGTEETYLIAEQCVINGVVFDSVGVKYKGNSTYRANQVKNPLHIALDFVKNQDYEGYKDIKLSNIFADPAQIREAVSYDILSKYMHCSKANYAKVYINDQYYGLMTNVEHVGKSFVRDHFGSSQNSFFKCNPVGGAGPNGNTYPTLVFTTYDSSKYYSAYERKSDYGWKELISMMDSLKNNLTHIESVLDVDRALWMHAFNNVLVNLDSYAGAFAQNYYLYQDDDNRFNSIVWDLNMSFGSFVNLGSGGVLDSTKMKQMDIFVQSTNTLRPLISQLLNIPSYRKMYVAHVRTITKEMIETGYYLNLAKKFMTIIDSAVFYDKNKFVSFQQYKDGLYKPASGGFMGTTVPVATLMQGRLNFLKANSEYNKLPPNISKVEPPSNPIINSIVSITATVTNNTKILLGYRKDHYRKFNKIEMFDDGLHDDGMANDGIYGARFYADGNVYEYYVYAENADAGIFSPVRAEHEFYSFQTQAQLPAKGEVVINEFMADNTKTQKDPSDQFEDWIELYNNSNRSIDLSGLYLTDDENYLNKWAIPNGTNIQANQFLIIWADEDKTQIGLHSNFKLKKSGEFLGLTDGLGIFLDSIFFPQQYSDTSFARFPNGVGTFTYMLPTFNAINEFVITKQQELESKSLIVFPNPSSSILHINFEGLPRSEYSFQLMDPLGRILQEQSFPSFQTQTLIDVKDLPNGLFLIRLSDSKGRTVQKKIMVQH
jgi:hypothetical protein